MRVLSQNVSAAELTIDQKAVAKIGKGLVLFLGFTEGDTQDIVQKTLTKVLAMRVFPDSAGKTNLALDQIQGDVLCIPNFTLYGSIAEGRRPSFIRALNPATAKALFEYAQMVVTSLFPKASFGVFGADMTVKVHNDGPFSMVHDSKELL